MASKRPPRRIWVALGLSGQWYGCTFQWVKRAIPYVPEVRGGIGRVTECLACEREASP